VRWLLSNEDFSAAIGVNNGWVIELFWDNGIICESDATTQFICASTEYDVPDCPFCGANDNRHYPLSDKRWKCKKCLRKFSITSGRYIDNTKMPLTYWWRFCWLMARSKKINSYEIARDLEITQDSAWHMIDTVKRALKDSGVIMKNASLAFKNNWEVMSLLMKVEKEASKNLK
jgi:transposase-like protein